MILMAILLQAAAPGADAVDLGKRVAESGMLARMIPMIAEGEASDMIKGHPELSAPEQQELRAIARATAARGQGRLVDAMGAAYATRLSAADMRAIVAFNDSPAAKRWKATEPDAIKAAIAVLGGIDFKGDVLKQVCDKTGKACAKK